MCEIERAVQILRSGGLVAFPTETVYGLGADATNGNAIDKIYRAKGRPSTNPLIAHVSDMMVAQRYVAYWPTRADRLADRFWPGPLTLVLPKRAEGLDSIHDSATAGASTVGVRAPDHPIALELLRAFDGAIVAPSANRTNRVSPTTAQHVRDELGTQVDLILDGGPCSVGIESTVLDLTRPIPTILRPGGVSLEAIQREIGDVLLAPGVVDERQASASPGQHAVHYAPRATAYRFSQSQIHRVEQMALSAQQPTAVILLTERHLHPSLKSVLLSDDPLSYARNLYATMRALDDENIAVIYIELPPALPEWAAVRDRIMRATRALPQ